MTEIDRRGSEQFEPRRVAVEDAEAEATEELDLIGIVIEHGRAIEFFAEDGIAREPVRTASAQVVCRSARLVIKIQ